MNDPTTWIIIALFYAPLHYLGPVLLVFVRSDAVHRRHVLRTALRDCTVTMVISFSLAIWLVNRDSITPAMLILLVSLMLPYAHVLWQQRRSA